MQDSAHSNQQDLSLSSIGSTLTDQALEKEETIKKLKRKMRILKQAVHRERDQKAALEEEVFMLRSQLSKYEEIDLKTPLNTAGNKTTTVTENLDEEYMLRCREKAEREAYAQCEQLVNDFRSKIQVLEDQKETMIEKLQIVAEENMDLKDKFDKLFVDYEDLH